MEDFKTIFIKKYKEITQENKRFKDITTIKIGGKIKFLVYPRTIKELIKIIKLCQKYGEKYVIIGNGSNVLASDDFFDGVVINTKQLKKLKITKNNLYAECGAMLTSCVLYAKDSGLSSLEWAIGIPGTVGGACVMNAGAFGCELFDYISYVLVFDGKRIKKLYKKDIKYSYRTTDFQKNGNVVLLVKFSLLQKSNIEIAKNIDYFMQKRANLQKISYPNAGSVFKKPSKEVSASQLIDMAGLKGKSFGGAEVSVFHAGFIVNYNNASCKDVLKLIDFISEKVYNIFNIKLELEIVYIG